MASPPDSCRSASPGVEASSLAVAIVSTQATWRGGEEQARLLAHGLARRGHRVFLLARRDGLFLQRMSGEGFDLDAFSGSGRSLWAIWQLRRALGRIRPEVLHYNDSHALSGAGLASLGLGIPARIAARRLDFPIRSPRRYRALSDGVICVSQAVADQCARDGLPEWMLHVVHDGVAPTRAASGDRLRGRQSLALGPSQRLLLVVAMLTDHKGHTFLLDAMPAVLARHPEVRLALAGDGELREALQRQAQQLGIAPQVLFLGFRDDVPDLIHAADLFVLPSHMEGMGSTLIDVMLSGVPIVTTTAGGIPEVVGGGPSGQTPVAWCVPPRSPQALSEAILDALERPERAASLAQSALHRAQQRFLADVMVDSTVAVYRKCLARKT